MEGIDFVRFYDESFSNIIREVMANINTVRKKIIYLFGGDCG
jgi:hypothetical protein